MPKSIIVPDSEKQDLVDYYKAKRQEMLVVYNETRDKLKHIGDMLKQLESNDSDSVAIEAIPAQSALALDSEDISLDTLVSMAKMTWFERLKYTFDHYDRGLTTREVVDYVCSVDKSIESATAMKSVSANLSTGASQHGLYWRWKNEGSGDWIYGPRKKFNEDGSKKE